MWLAFTNENPILQQGKRPPIKFPRLNGCPNKVNVLELSLMIGMLENQECANRSFSANHTSTRPAMLSDDFPKSREVSFVDSKLILHKRLNFR